MRGGGVLPLSPALRPSSGMDSDLSRRPTHHSPTAPRTPRLDRIARGVLRRHAELLRQVHDTDSVTIRDQVDVTTVPAPPFGEERRAAWMRDRLAEYGVHDVELDATGNVIGRIPGTDTNAPPLIVSAHLDTVFPAGTDVTPRVEGDRIAAPGISDDGRGLAALLALARLLAAGPARTTAPLILAATVGEEGIGDLRGVRGLFAGKPGTRAAGFISLDGAGITRVVSAGIGSRRHAYRVSGPGGHSWVNFGRPNPIEILARALATLPRADELPAATTWSAGRIGGGTSINAIPEEAWVEVEVRSEREDDLRRVQERITTAFETALSDANRTARQMGASVASDRRSLATLEVATIGDRPAGHTPSDAVLVGAAVAATRALDLPVELATSSTDANLPMSLGVPAVTIGAGGEASGAHTLGEWYRNTLGPEGVVRALLTVLIWDQATAEARATQGAAAD